VSEASSSLLPKLTVLTHRNLSISSPLLHPNSSSFSTRLPCPSVSRLGGGYSNQIFVKGLLTIFIGKIFLERTKSLRFARTKHDVYGCVKGSGNYQKSVWADILEFCSAQTSPKPTYNLLAYLLTPWSRVLLEKLTSKLCN